jgi:hypothetical protein
VAAAPTARRRVTSRQPAGGATLEAAVPRNVRPAAPYARAPHTLRPRWHRCRRRRVRATSPAAASRVGRPSKSPASRAPLRPPAPRHAGAGRRAAANLSEPNATPMGRARPSRADAPRMRGGSAAAGRGWGDVYAPPPARQLAHSSSVRRSRSSCRCVCACACVREWWAGAKGATCQCYHWLQGDSARTCARARAFSRERRASVTVRPSHPPALRGSPS